MYCRSCLGVNPAEKVSITRVSGWTRMKSKQTNPLLFSLNKHPANDQHRYLCDCHACVSDVCSPFPESWTFSWDDRSETDLPNIISDRLALKMWTCSPFQLHIHTWKKWAFSLGQRELWAGFSSLMAASLHVHLPNAVLSRYAVFCRTCSLGSYLCVFPEAQILNRNRQRWNSFGFFRSVLFFKTWTCGHGNECSYFILIFIFSEKKKHYRGFELLAITSDQNDVYSHPLFFIF